MLQLLLDHLYRSFLHLEAAVDVSHSTFSVAVTSASHNLRQRCMGLAEHRQVGVPQAVEIEVADAHLTDAFALICKRARFDVLAIRLRADEVEARPGRWVALLEGDNLLDWAALVVFGWKDVVVEIVFAIRQLVGPLLLSPVS